MSLRLRASAATVVALACAWQGLATTAIADDTHTTTLLCQDVGETTVEITGDLARGGSARITTEGPVALNGVVGFSGTDASGAAITVDPTGEGTLCVGDSVEGKRLDQVLPADQVPAGQEATRVTGNLVFRATVDQASVVKAAPANVIRPAALANDPAGYGPVVSFPYDAKLKAYTGGRYGSVTVAHRKAGTRTIHVHTKGSSTNVTASIVKVGIMATVMRRAQEQGRGLSAWEKSQIVPMIRQSDNAAASNLWRHIGGGSSMGRVLSLMGLRSTTPGPASYWGLTVTNAPDQVVLVDHFVRANPVLTDSNRAYGLSLMKGASSWGVTAGPGTGIWIKNGWLPRTDGWHVNSIGHAPNVSNPYSIAVLTHANTSQATQNATIEGVSRIVYANRASVRPDTRAGVRGDWTGDGRSDLLGTKGGYLYVFRNSNGVLQAPQRIGGGGWGQVTWMGSPGDLNGDGHADLLGRFRDGRLMLYWGTGNGVVSAGQVGHGWDTITAISTLDIDGNGQYDVVGRTKEGDLMLYGVSASGLWRKHQVGHGWNAKTNIVGVSHMNGDRLHDIVTTDSNGLMHGYRSTGSVFYLMGQVGHGWQSSEVVVSPGDLDNDGKTDLVAKAGARLTSYKVDGRGNVYTMSTNNGQDVSGFTLLA